MAVRFTVHVEGLPSSWQAAISQIIQTHIAAAVRGGAPLAAAQAAAEAAARAAAEAATRDPNLPPPVPPPEVKLPEGARRVDCTICLEALEPGQGVCRPPCLHAFHGPCLRRWLGRSPLCPVCKLNLAPQSESEARGLRFRLAELQGLAARELRYLSGYLGIAVERGAERPELELSLVGCPSVRILARQQELRSLPVSRLRALLHSAGVRPRAGLVEKADLVDALFGSGRFLQDFAEEDEAPADASPAGAGSQAGPERTARRTDARAAPY